MSASQTSSVLGRRLRRLFTNAEPLPRISFSLYSFIGSCLPSTRDSPYSYRPSNRISLTSEPLIASLFPFPEGAKRAVFTHREVLALLVRATHVSIAHCDRLDPMFVEELPDLPLDPWVSRYVGSDPSLDDRLGILCREHTCGDLGRGLVVGTVKGHGARRVRHRFLSL